MVIEQPLYLKLAWGELDVAEVSGPADNPRIVAYHDTTQGGGDVHDEVSWCSSFINAMVTRAGLVGTNSKAAISWMNWGEPCQLEYGCIAVSWRFIPDDWRSHVTIVVGYDADHYFGLGGNQSNRVRVSRYPLNKLRGYRRAA